MTGSLENTSCKNYTGSCAMNEINLALGMRAEVPGAAWAVLSNNTQFLHQLAITHSVAGILFQT